MIRQGDIYKNTYRELVLWVEELLQQRRYDEQVYVRNILQAGRIMELEFDLARVPAIMVYDLEETVMEKYGTADIIPEDELIRRRKAKGGGGPDGDWLTKMAWGTMFFSRKKNRKDWLLVKFLKAGNRGTVVLLVPMQGAEEVVADDRDWLAVDPVEFCKTWECVELIPPVPLESSDG